MEASNHYVGTVRKDGYTQVLNVYMMPEIHSVIYFTRLVETSFQKYNISGSYDATVFVWDIGGRKGTVYELHGHRQKVTFIRFLSSTNQLMTAGEDGNLVLWDMATKRAEVMIFYFLIRFIYYEL